MVFREKCAQTIVTDALKGGGSGTGPPQSAVDGNDKIDKMNKLISKRGSASDRDAVP